MTISTVLTLVMYLLYLFGMNFPNIPKKIMSTHVPIPNANIEAAPDLQEPEAAANIHIAVSAPHGAEYCTDNGITYEPSKKGRIMSDWGCGRFLGPSYPVFML